MVFILLAQAVIYFAGHVQIEGLSIDVPSKIVRTRKEGRKWFAQMDSGSEFFVGREVPYKANWGLTNYSDDSAGLYKPAIYRAQYGFWADFIYPTVVCESNGGHFNCLNTYDSAYFTFGFLQYAAHVPNGDFVQFFTKLLKSSLGKGYFSDLKVEDNQILRKTASGTIALTTNTSTRRLMEYLNPTLASVEEIEVIQAAKFVHWSINSQEQRDMQVSFGISHFKQAMQNYATHYPLDGAPDKVCIVVADIRHQGRAKSQAIMEALDTDGDWKSAFRKLIELGRDNYKERITSLKDSIANLESTSILGKRVYSKRDKDFVLD